AAGEAGGAGRRRRGRERPRGDGPGGPERSEDDADRGPGREAGQPAEPDGAGDGGAERQRADDAGGAVHVGRSAVTWFRDASQKRPRDASAKRRESGRLSNGLRLTDANAPSAAP